MRDVGNEISVTEASGLYNSEGICKACGQLVAANARVMHPRYCAAGAVVVRDSTSDAALSQRGSTLAEPQYDDAGRCRDCGSTVGVGVRAMHPRYCGAGSRSAAGAPSMSAPLLGIEHALRRPVPDHVVDSRSDHRESNLAKPATPVDDWSNIENIRGEWPRGALDPATDLQRYRQALALFEREDYPSMMRCATAFATALAHSLYGTGILKGDELPETVHKALYCSLCAPPDGRTFADSAQKAARLALTIMRENGWQPPAFGGSVTHFERMLLDRGNNLLLCTAIAPPNQPWAGDLKSFFAVASQRTVATLPNSEWERAGELIARIGNSVQESEAGDTASSLYVRGMALSAQSDIEGALAKHTEAAKLGSVDAMAEAGALSAGMGRQADATFWYESAAKAGHPVGMFNTAIASIEKGDIAAAKQWFQRSAEAGNAEGYAALTQLADESGDEIAEAHWARLGTEAGHIFCMGRYGLLLARDARGDLPTMRRARDVLEQAADRGDLESASLAINLNHQLNDPQRAQRLVTMVIQSGDQEAVDRLRRYGFL